MRFLISLMGGLLACSLLLATDITHKTAVVIFKVPADAKLYLNSELLSGNGTIRNCVISKDFYGKPPVNYSTLRIEIERGIKFTSKEFELTTVAGREYVVSLYDLLTEVDFKQYPNKEDLAKELNIELDLIQEVTYKRTSENTVSANIDVISVIPANIPGRLTRVVSNKRSVTITRETSLSDWVIKK